MRLEEAVRAHYQPQSIIWTIYNCRHKFVRGLPCLFSVFWHHSLSHLKVTLAASSRNKSLLSEVRMSEKNESSISLPSRTWNKPAAGSVISLHLSSNPQKQSKASGDKRTEWSLVLRRRLKSKQRRNYEFENIDRKTASKLSLNYYGPKHRFRVTRLTDMTFSSAPHKWSSYSRENKLRAWKLAPSSLLNLYVFFVVVALQASLSP